MKVSFTGVKYLAAIMMHHTIMYTTAPGYIYICKQMNMISPVKNIYYLPNITAALQPPKPDAVFMKLSDFIFAGAAQTLT